MKSKKNDEQVSITKRWELDSLPKITPKKSTKNGKKKIQVNRNLRTPDRGRLIALQK